MIRRAFVRRMVFAGLATWFLDLPLPSEPEPDPPRWHVVGTSDDFMVLFTRGSLALRTVAEA